MRIWKSIAPVSEKPMKLSTFALIAVAGVIGAVVGGVAGGSYAVMRTQASAAAWQWLEVSILLANADGSRKDAEQQRDSLNAAFVAQTGALPGTLAGVPDDALRSRVIERARLLAAHPDAVMDTPLTLGRRKQAMAVLACIAAAANDDAARRCANG